MLKLIPIFSLIVYSQLISAQPDIAQLIELNNSVVSVSVELPDGNTGTGSGVVVNNNYVATDCHVLVNSRGVSIAKFGTAYQPTAFKADWKHDLCLLKFDQLPFKSVPMRDSASLKYEEEAFSLSYPYHSQVPQASYGMIKAIYPFDGSVIVRSNAEFAMGSSGGAMFDKDFNLIGITTFKSPGRAGYFYSLPVEWIKRLFDAPDLMKLTSDEVPFWALSEEQRPFFMRVVIPFQQEKWNELNRISQLWATQEPNSADALYYRGEAEYGLKHLQQAQQYLVKAATLNPRHLEAQVKLALMAIDAGNKPQAEKMRDIVKLLDADEAENLTNTIAAMQNSVTQ